MVHKKILAWLAIIMSCCFLSFPVIYVKATESSENSEEQSEEKKESDKEDKEDDDEDLTDEEKAEKEAAKKKAYQEQLQESIKQKQEALDSAKDEKKELQGNLTDVKQMVSALESQKDDLDSYVIRLDSHLNDVQSRIETMREKIAEKESEIAVSQGDLAEAESVRDIQYTSMKSRIQFMYEKGNNYYVEMLLSSDSFGDMVNKADYIEKLSEYDQRMLVEYEQNCEYIDACKAALESEKEVLDAAIEQIELEEDNLNVLIEAKEQEITDKEYDIANKEEAIKEYEAELAEQASIIKALEASVMEERRKLAEENGEILTYDGGYFAFPAPSYTRVSDDYGDRIHPILGVHQFHNGVDLAAPGGSPIVAAYDGEIVATSYSGTMGNYVMINHGDGLYTIYMHASAIYVSEGQQVVRGQKIAAVGSTGRSTGNHLHFTVRENGNYVSPWNYISKP